MSTIPGDYKLESHISDQQRSDTDTFRLENQLHTSVPGQQELNSQVTIENTTGHTDIDHM